MHLFASFLTVALCLTSVSSKQTRGCRCTFGSDCWPSDSEFRALASKVSQPLIHPVPPATPCYNPAAGNCTDVRAGWFNGAWRSDQSGAAEHPNFETYTFPNGTIQGCYLNTALGFPCQQGNVPVVGVDARTPSDVQEAVKFAGNHNLRLVIKTTGHDYIGRSSARGSFLIWTHYLKDIAFHDSFSPTGATDGVTYDNVFTFGAGVQWFEAYNAAKQRNRVLVGGFSPRGSVGAAGGWLQGGGHSVLSPSYGLGVDNVLEITIVTANGHHVIANAYNNRALFWALRGGGGGSWGVVTSVSYKTHPSTPFVGVSLNVNSANPNSTRKLLTEIVRLTPSLVDQGYGGSVNGTVDGFQFFILSPNVTVEQANATLITLSKFANSQPGLSVQSVIIPFPDFSSFYEPTFANTDGLVGVPNEISSWLLPKDVIHHRPEHVVIELLKLPVFSYFLVTGGQVSRVDPDAMGLNPAWRNSLAYTAFGRGWQEGATLTEINAVRQLLIQDMKTVEAIAPESGAYINEASPYEFDWKKSFFGSHYHRLRVIKQRYDPNSIFLVHEGIGSVGWDRDLVCPVKNRWEVLTPSNLESPHDPLEPMGAWSTFFEYHRSLFMYCIRTFFNRLA